MVVSRIRVRTHVLAFIIFIFIAGGVAGVSAQVSRTTGTLQGSVVDQSGGAIPGASVRLVNPGTNQSRAGVTGATGTFVFTGVPVGTYELTVVSPGFSTYRNNAVEISVGSITGIGIRMGPASVQEQVKVSVEAGALDATQASVATTIGPERIEESPVVTRSYINFVLLAPSLSQSDNGGSATSSSVLPDSGFTFAGLRSRSNSLYIDGVENNDEFDGSVRTELSPETVDEFQIVSNGISAESGGGAGGAINVVTKGGANIRHGDAFLFVQNGALDAREPLTNETTQPTLDRGRVGFALGGPIIRNRTFFYVAGEQERSRGEDSSLIDPAMASSINSILSSATYSGLRTRTLNPGTFEVERAETETSGRLDHAINASNALLLKFAFTNNREAGDAFNLSGLVDPSSRGSSFTRDEGLTGGLSSVVGPTTVNSAAFQISRRTQVLRTSDAIGPGIDIAGAAEFGRPYAGNGRRTEDHYEVLNTTSFLRGAHLLKVGVDIDHIGESAAIADGFGAYYVFPTVAAFSDGTPYEYLQSWGNPLTRFASTRFAGFVQDHLTASRRVTLDLGLRYDFEQLPSMFRRDINNLAPRLGVAFSPSANWVLRGGFGVFYDRYLLAAANRSLEWNGVQAFQQVEYGLLAAETFRSSRAGAATVPAADIPPSIFASSARLATPYSEIASGGIQRLLSANLTISATYLFAHGVKLPRTVNTNLLPPDVLTMANASALGFSTVAPQEFGREVFGPGRLNPGLDNIYEWQDQSSSTYNGVSIALNRRLANDIEFSGSYTLSQTLDDASDYNEQPQNPYAIRAERAFSANDQRHRFVFSGTFDLPFGDEEEEGGKAASGLVAKVFGRIEAAPIVTVGSGRPIDPLVGVDANHNAAFPLSSRPIGFSRNALRTPSQIEADLRLLKYFKIGDHGKLDLVAESFNLLNHTNITGLNQFFGLGATPAAGFATPDRAAIARELQFSVDFEF